MTSGVNLPFRRLSFRILYFKFDWVPNHMNQDSYY